MRWTRWRQWSLRSATPEVRGGPTHRIAFAGAGLIAAVHRDAIDHVPGLSISAVASRSAARTAQAAAQFRVPGLTLRELPGDADAVLIATAPAHHARAAIAAMAAEVPVLVEKPLCTTLADADALVEVCAAGGRLAYAENLLHAPAVGLALDHINDLSQVDQLEVRAIQPRPTWGEFLTEAWGGGALFDLGAHPIALALLFAAPAVPVEVRAVLEGADDHPMDEFADVSMRFDNGSTAHVVVSWQATDEVTWDAQVSAPDGVVRLELLPDVRLERNGDEVPLPAIPDGVPAPLEELGFRAQMAAFADDIATARAPMIGAAFGRSVLDLTCAAYASAGQDGAWVPLPFAGPRDRTPWELWRRP